jgi:hypothetical protein
MGVYNGTEGTILLLYAEKWHCISAGGWAPPSRFTIAVDLLAKLFE